MSDPIINILKMLFGGGQAQASSGFDTDPGITGGTMKGGGGDGGTWGANNPYGLPANMPRDYRITDHFDKGTVDYGTVARGNPIGPTTVVDATGTVPMNTHPDFGAGIHSAAPQAPEHRNILQMLFGNLTKTGVQDTSGKQKFYNDPSQAGVALAQAMRPMAHPQTSDISGDLSAPGDARVTGQDYTAPPAGGVGPPQDPNQQFGYDSSTDPSPTFNSPASGGLLPHIFRPSFRQAATDEAGNIRSASPGLTKGGLLLKIIGGGLQGSLDAMASGALDAVPGRSPFGAGVEGAVTMPWLRARRYQALQQQAQENQIRQDEVSSLPARRAQRNAQAAATLDSTQAEGALRRAQTTRALRGQMPTKDSPLEQRQSFADEHGDMFKDKNERTNFVLYGTQPKAATKNPTEWSLRVDAANGDEDAQQVLDQRNRDQRALAGIRHAGNSKQAAAEDAASAEQIAAKIMNKSNGDPDAALAQFDQLSPHVEDPQQRRLGPLIRRAIRGRKRINKPQSPIDKILSGDVEGGLNQMQQPQQ